MTPSWEQGDVNQGCDHIRIYHVDAERVLALLGHPINGLVQVEFRSIDSEAGSALADVRRELDVFFGGIADPNDPWSYAHYHCGTFANAMSRLQWGSFPDGVDPGGEVWSGIPRMYVEGAPFGSDTNDTLVVAAGAAWDYYRRHSAYVCQDGRSFRATERMAFYRRKRIEPRIPEILDRRDHVPFTRETASALRESGAGLDLVLADVIADSLDEGSRHEGQPHQVFLLSPPDDPRTIAIAAPILHLGKNAWTMGQRYASAARLSRAKTTSDLDPGAPAQPVVLHRDRPAVAPLSPVQAPSTPAGAASTRPEDFALRRFFVQFMHPGGEHGPDAHGFKAWNVGDHKRKFLRITGDALASAEPGGQASPEELVFWGEWEPESEVETLTTTVRGGPSWIHHPYYERPAEFRRDGKVLQNTDPFVFGDRFLYTLCRQWKKSGDRKRPTFLRDLDVGSLILFGSSKDGFFLLDTVFVVGASALHNAETWPTALRGLVSDTYEDVTIRPSYEWGGGEELRLYLGATPNDPVDGMFSFVPCLPAGNASAGFPRPRIELEGMITPTLAMGAKSTRVLSGEQARGIWEDVVDTVLEQGLMLGTRFDLPERRGAGRSATVPGYVERRIRRSKPDGCNVLPSSTPIVSFGNPSTARVATLGLNPSRIEFETYGRELDGDARRFETLGSLGVESLEPAPAATIERVWARANNYFKGNPYGRWFDPLEQVLRAVGASYDDGSACHLDLSQWATDPTWNGLAAAIRVRLVDEDAPFLAEQLRTEPIELLLLNGRGVIDGFTDALGARLEEVSGVTRENGARTAFCVGSFDGITVIGWSTNLQSSFGVTLELRRRIAARVAELCPRSEDPREEQGIPKHDMMETDSRLEGLHEDLRDSRQD